MSISSHFRRRFKHPPRGVLSALLALTIGWSLALAHAASLSRGDGPDGTHVSVHAELRVGAPAPAPVADVGDAQASLRALHARARYAPQQHPLAKGTHPSAAAAWLASAMPLCLHGRARSTSGAGAGTPSHRASARRWPLPRSSCSDSDPDPAPARNFQIRST